MPTPLGEAAQMRNPLLSDLCREHRAKPVPPKSDSLMADVDLAFGQEVLDVSQRQWVPHLHHHDQTNHFWRAVEIAEWAAPGPELPRSEAARRIALTPPAKMGSHHGRHFHLMLASIQYKKHPPFAQKRDHAG